MLPLAYYQPRMTWIELRLAEVAIPGILTAMRGRYWFIQYWEHFGPTFLKTNVVWGTTPGNLSNSQVFITTLPI